MKNYSDFFESNKNNGPVALIMRLSPHIVNFREGFIGKLRRTLVMTHGFSSSFGFDVDEKMKQPVIGVYPEYYGLFLTLRMKNVVLIEGKSGIYLTFKMHKDVSDDILAIKLNTTKIKNEIIQKTGLVHFVLMDNDGNYKIPTNSNSFNLPVITESSLIWEK
jgi:hypothetical protein